MLCYDSCFQYRAIWGGFFVYPISWIGLYGGSVCLGGMCPTPRPCDGRHLTMGGCAIRHTVTIVTRPCDLCHTPNHVTFATNP